MGDRVTVVLRREDFNPYALALGIWDSLTIGLPEGVESVTVVRVKEE